jgi:predicted Zn-dependent peptidase
MGLKFDGNIKLDLNIAINVTITILVLLTLNYSQQTQQTVQEIPENVKDITRGDIVKIIETVNEQGNTTALTQKQILQISNKIYNEVR